MDRTSELVSILRDIKAQKAALDEELKPLEEGAREELASLIAEHGRWEDDYGYAHIQSDGVRQVWDTKRLNELIENDPAGTYQWLLDYREEKPVKGGLRVK